MNYYHYTCEWIYDSLSLAILVVQPEPQEIHFRIDTSIPIELLAILPDKELHGRDLYTVTLSTGYRSVFASHMEPTDLVTIIENYFIYHQIEYAIINNEIS